ncbi:hypothetical protein HYT55_01085 [Candidatus Woesearchaeota archaeon]|nr:hypothetical protein [Candidatus Woesearchaeota archaeon]
MPNHKTPKVRTPFTRDELEQTLASVFESHRGQGYAYMDHDYDRPMTETAYDRLISYFDDDRRKLITSRVQETLSRAGTHHLMDQGCGHANSLNMVARRFARQFPQNEYRGYGVSASLEDMWLGQRAWEDDEMIEDDDKLLEKHNVCPFRSWDDEKENVRFFGIEEDVHKMMEQFPYPLDLVFSDNTYFHLFMPWLALKRTADKLAVGGVAVIRTLFQFSVDSTTGRPMSERSLVELLEKDNPDYHILSSDLQRGRRVLAILKNGEAQFRTNQHICRIETLQRGGYKYVGTFYSRKPQAHSLSLDEL